MSLLDANQYQKNLILLKNTYDKTCYYKHKDPEVALNMARKTIEILCQTFYLKEFPENNTSKLVSLDKTLHQLKGAIPDKVMNHLRTIQNWSNFGSHYQEDQADSDDIDSTMEALDQVINWFNNTTQSSKICTEDEFLVEGFILKDHKNQDILEYEEQVREALSDNKLTKEEIECLKSLRKIKNISPETAQEIYKRVKKEHIEQEGGKKSILTSDWLLSDKDIKDLLGDCVLNLPTKGDIYLGANIPEKKLKNACHVCNVPDANKQKIFILMDMTLFGSATDVLLMGPQYVYFHNDGGRSLGARRVPLHDFMEASLQVENDLIEIGNNEFFHTSIVPEIFSFKGFSSNIGAAEQDDVLLYLKFIQTCLKGMTLAQK